MPKKIVLCFDGTWNEPDDNTNVTKIFRSIEGEDRSPEKVGRAAEHLGGETIKWYDKGVGTKFGNKIRGGLAGRGLSENILQGYMFLVENYEAEDEIYLFGFSRGAYTARSLVGLIRNIGLLRRQNLPEADLRDNPILTNGFRMYQRRDSGPDSEEAIFFRKKYSVDSFDIKFLGVWDTVGAMGIPSNDLDTQGNQYEFHDTKLSSSVKNAYHALAIDETRPEFRPTLWTSTPKPGQTVEQVWFAGVHSEVGGGQKPALTDLPLRWMQENAMANGLVLDPGQLVWINKQDYFNAKVSDHFRSFWENATWKPTTWNFYSLWAWKRNNRPHYRPIGGTPVECVQGLVFEKIDASGGGYKPVNDGLHDTDTCLQDFDTWVSTD